VLTSRQATEADVAVLAVMNQQLIEDEASANPMSLAELTARMRDFLAGAYSAVLFELTGEPVAYALFRAEGDGIFLRQFFVGRAHRGIGIGRRAMSLLISDYFPPGCRVTVDVLVGNEPALRFWEAAGFRHYAVTLERHADPGPA
jgi:GNAT superfamily N-acetyltransferase